MNKEYSVFWTKELVEAVVLVHEFFFDQYGTEKGLEKTAAWFTTPNPFLGHLMPVTLLRVGREKRLILCIRNLLNGNF